MPTMSNQEISGSETEIRYKSDILTFLGGNNVVNLATCDKDGMPHATSLLYANDGFNLYWFSDSKTRHSQHIASGGQVAATIAPGYQDFTDIKGLQITGHCSLVKGTRARAVGIKFMFQRYEFLEKFVNGPASLKMQINTAALYRLDPNTITLIDNSKGFGWKHTLNFEGSGTG